MAFLKVPNTLPVFCNFINERSFKPSVYIVCLEYRFVYDDFNTKSNEILQFDPAYTPFKEDPKYPWYFNYWCWYTDWYMCVDPESVKVIDFVELDDVFDFINAQKKEIYRQIREGEWNSGEA